jgi:SagB-type dehydrogenase family enzyme
VVWSVTGTRKRTLRRAKSLTVYWKDSRLFLHNFSTRNTVSAKPVACEVLDVFDRWRTPEAAVNRLRAYTRRSVLTAIAQLARNDLLLWRNSREARLDSRVAREWSPWLPHGSFHFATKDIPYRNQSWTIARRRAALPKSPRPPHFKTINGAAKISLPPRSFSDSEFLRVLLKRRTYRKFSHDSVTLEGVAQLLSLVWGITGYLHTPVYGKLPLKTSPSGGARHPGEVYLIALRVKGLQRGLYHYHAERHHLERITARVTPAQVARYCANQQYTKNAAALFLMTAVFGRPMWKYRNARAYRVVLLDAGHLCQTFCLVATWLGLAPFCTAALKDTSIEKALRIDGISESILYVAGVGGVPTSARGRRESFRIEDLRVTNPNRGGVSTDHSLAR